MNYYEHHLGDYDGATAHLSWLEDCAYRRLICLSYRNEGPIPADVKQVCRLVRAASKAERDAVQQVLSEFFELQEDGWHNARCDEEIARFKSKQAKAKASANARWNAERAHSDGNANAPANAMRTHSEGNAPRARPQTPDTINTSPSLRSGEGRASRLTSRPDDVGEQTWADWCALRKGKKATVTETVVAEARREAEKAGLSLERFLAIWCMRGSQGLQADWLRPDERNAVPNKHSGFASRNYREGIAEDGSFA